MMIDETHMPGGSSRERDADVLLSRMIDGEASADDQRAFEALAEENPILWRDLALGQRDSTALAIAVKRRLAAAEHVELPSPRGRAEAQNANRRAGAGPWLLAGAGWAAAAILAAALFFADWERSEASGPVVVHAAQQVSPDEQLRSYLRAPYVLGELEPMMERVDELPDGRIAVVALRRIQEVVFLDEDDILPVDEDRHFMKDPAELREMRH